jgi:cysteine desulfurase
VSILISMRARRWRRASRSDAGGAQRAVREFVERPLGGKRARHAVDKARAGVAGLLGCDADKLVFTSGRSEANRHALKGVFFDTQIERRHIITTQVEHPAVISPRQFLESLGAKITYLQVDAFGRVDPDDVWRAVAPDTILIP